ncbi:MAG: efflux RND transporter periplasmic adaptor subunit [Prevotella sp.]|jgi:cobalt-zinc-cadmium efflux system membrane fusion protein|nr:MULTISPECIES: efflux RND transporter periplasmic adaptor subunit [unclassified Prevotella]MCH3970541.1 efflux RND transporter periplasmic adaptor subunit [Prevotella sp.]MCH3986131.1 efflux RND transporter periplasmic adaptor subunit [Prevotella sp.]MCH3992978.1 efflux RND transporter periplasmic adaptor subunit [Prevotella sp.]MCH4018091.1 efflux RND transporter periplasmic adaptor subunit [Prevotella sp.]MCH4186563.1 efflux RND transporter periplasmic adaptor subunit [Prevotella sp.]
MRYTKEYFLLVMTMTLLAACGNHGKKNSGTATSAPADSLKDILESAPVTQEFMYDEVVLNGNIACDESRLGKVFIPCSGRISGIQVEKGDEVRKGQYLATVHSSDAADYIKEMSEAAADIHIASRELRMKRDMLKSGMASEKDVVEAREKLFISEAERNRLRTIAGINGFASRSNAVLRSPVTGYVITKNVYNDSYIDNSDNEDPAFEIADLSDVWVIGDVYESDIAKIHTGEHVYVTTMAYSDLSLPGIIDKIYSIIDSASKTMKVRVKLHNPKGELKPGMFANIHVMLPTQGKRVTCVPASAVIFENGNNYVIVNEGKGRYHKQQIQIIHNTEDKDFISGGVHPGQKVVVKNALLVFNALSNE